MNLMFMPTTTWCSLKMFSLILDGGLQEHRGASFVPFLASTFAPNHKNHLAWYINQAKMYNAEIYLNSINDMRVGCGKMHEL